MEIGGIKTTSKGASVLVDQKVTKESFSKRARDLCLSVFGSMLGLTIGTSLGSALSTRISSSIEGSKKFQSIYDALEGTGGKSPWLRTTLVAGMGIAGIACALTLRGCNRKEENKQKESKMPEEKKELNLFT